MMFAGVRFGILRREQQARSVECERATLVRIFRGRANFEKFPSLFLSANNVSTREEEAQL